MTNCVQPFVSIIILNWNGTSITLDCLKSLNNIDYNNYNIILVDNGSLEKEFSELEIGIIDYPKVKLLALKKNHGFTGGNNIGIKYALDYFLPDYFLLLNNDTEVASNFLKEMIAPFFTDNKIAAVVPKIFYYDRSDILWYAGGYINKLSCIGEHYGKGKRDSSKYSKARYITFMNGCAMLIKGDILRKLDGLDDVFFANSEDTDLSFRIKALKQKIYYQPNSVIWHKVSYTFNSSDSKAFSFYLNTRNTIILQFKHNKLKIYFFVGLTYFLIRWFLYLEIKFFLLGNFEICKHIIYGVQDGLSKRNRFIK